DNADLFRDAFWMTIRLALLAGVLCLLFGTLLAVMRVSPVPVLRGVGTVYVNIVRNTPLTLVFVFVFFGFPKLGISAAPFKVAIIALTVYTSAFVCEAVRSGINTVATGQAEAARAMGMTFGQTLTTVILPQALRSVVPPLVSTIIAMTKNTTIAAGFSVAEAGRIRAVLTEPDPLTGVSYDQLYILIWVAACFVVILVPLSLLQQSLERRWRAG
ncbi:MAG: amino acid ABC transporter permease, partial [Ilumatobacteraceae bacterium]